MKKKNTPLITSKPNARKVVQYLTKKKEVLSPLLILTHDYPDPDALASSFALYYLAGHHFNITCRIVYGGVIGRTENREMVRILRMPLHKFKAADLKRYANIALVDTQPAFENNPFPKERRATIVIDQHMSLDNPDAELAIIDNECGATSVILAQALLSLRIQIPQRVATALAYGIITDTLNLGRAKRPDIIKTYLNILSFCDMRALSRIQNPSRSLNFFATLKQAIKNAMICNKLVISHLGDVEYTDLVSQTADFLLTYDSMRWSLCTGRYYGKLHVSLRGRDPSTVASPILRSVFDNPQDAGGHDNIAGGSFDVGKEAPEARWREAENAVVQRLIERLAISSRRKFLFPFQDH
ncbi:MAG: DHH family phosphoesterase [Deltaproteobacteria bacterium]|nr:DHH family phosphoesterase [Deltaproteobacteria bacterium]